MTIYRPTVAQEMGGDHSINKADGILLGVIEFGVLIAGIIFFVWGIGYKLAFWGQHDPNTIYASANDVILPNLALGTGVLIAAWVYIRYLKR